MLCKVTHCAGRVSANTRPHQLCWGGQGDAWAISAYSRMEITHCAGRILANKFHQLCWRLLPHVQKAGRCYFMCRMQADATSCAECRQMLLHVQNAGRWLAATSCAECRQMLPHVQNAGRWRLLCHVLSAGRWLAATSCAECRQMAGLIQKVDGSFSKALSLYAAVIQKYLLWAIVIATCCWGLNACGNTCMYKPVKVPEVLIIVWTGHGLNEQWIPGSFIMALEMRLKCLQL